VQEVAAASAEQSAGAGQISKAMTQVDQVTQRNASAAEELASTAEEMASQAEALQQLVSYFRVAGLEAVPTPMTTALHRAPVAPPSVSKLNGGSRTEYLPVGALSRETVRHDDGDFKSF
jgi:methyl-accepting chemotaxis protein